MNTTVVNVKYDDYDILIDRSTIWGNKFRIGIDGTRDECCEKHKIWLFNHPELLILIPRLKGKRLGCCCKQPDIFIRCHGDTYSELADGIYSGFSTRQIELFTHLLQSNR